MSDTQRNTLDAIHNLKEKILRDYDRMTLDSTFTFACHPGVSCFNMCCRDVNIFLTPYDILRLKNRLGITSGEFLKKYTLMPIDRNQNYPVIQFAMDDSPEKKCHFVTEKGCSVYEDRPWPCRMYPVGSASPGEGASGEQFWFLMNEDVCKGFADGKEWTIREWLADQKIEKYDEFGELFKEVALHPWFDTGNKLDEKKMQMFFMACYNLDEFRRFLFGSTFFDRFEVPGELKMKLGEDDEELLRFAYRWLRFSLFGEKTMTVRNG